MQSLARHKPRTAPGGVEAADHAHRERNSHRHYEEIDTNVRFQKSSDGGCLSQYFYADGADQYTHHTPNQAEQSGFPQHHANDSPTFPANCEQNANFLSTLKHSHKHSVHDSEHTDKYGQQRSAPTHGLNNAVCLAVADMLACYHGAGFGDQFVDLFTEAFYIAGTRRGCNA